MAAYAPAMALQAPTNVPKCPACACGQKTTLRAPRWRSSRGTAPHRKSRPAAQQLAATEEWRPGRRRATRQPAEERATQRRQMGMRRPEKRGPSRRSLWHSTNLRAGELREALSPASSEVTELLHVLQFRCLPASKTSWCVSLRPRSKSTWRTLRWFTCQRLAGAFFATLIIHFFLSPVVGCGETLGPERRFRRLARRGSEKRLS